MSTYDWIVNKRSADPQGFALLRLCVKFEDFMRSAERDRKKNGKLSEETLYRQKSVKAFRSKLLSDGIVPFEVLREYENSHNFSFRV